MGNFVLTKLWEDKICTETSRGKFYGYNLNKIALFHFDTLKEIKSERLIKKFKEIKSETLIKTGLRKWISHL